MGVWEVEWALFCQNGKTKPAILILMILYTNFSFDKDSIFGILLRSKTVSTSSSVPSHLKLIVILHNSNNKNYTNFEKAPLFTCTRIRVQLDNYFYYCFQIIVRARILSSSRCLIKVSLDKAQHERQAAGRKLH